MSLIYNASFDSQTRILSLLDKAGNVISSCEVPSKEPVDDPNKPLTFRATQDGSTVRLYKYGSPRGEFQTSRDGGNTWVDYSLDTTITLNTGDEVSFRSMSHRASQDHRNYFNFIIRGKVEAWHNVMSMLHPYDFDMYREVSDYALSHLFYFCDLTKAPILPATSLAYYCYWGMFSSCRLLTKAPALPATALANSCFPGMFNDCESLKEVRISATTTEEGALNGWLDGVAATGDFYCDPNATIFPTGASGIPRNWVRRNIADYPN